MGKTSLPGTDFHGLRCYAGLIDIHTHGCAGVDTMDGTLEELARFQAKSGVTAFLPTSMTADRQKLTNLFNRKLPTDCGAQILGFHMEGPYIDPKFQGAQNGRFIRLPDIEEFQSYENIAMVTIAPELDGAMEFIRESKAVVCIGHTGADYETTLAAADAGAACLTHTFNAMPPLHHRKPAVLGAAFDKNMYVQLICDGIHVHPTVVRMLYRLFGSDRVVLISDSMRATGLPDGEYEFGALNITVKDKIARTPNGALAGSTSTLLDCVKCAIRFGIPEAEAFKMASETPAKLMGLNKGMIQPGYDCDLLILDEDNQVHSVIIGGNLVDINQ